MTTVHPVRLEGTRVALREFDQHDVDGLAAIVGSSEVTYWLAFDLRSHDETADMLSGIVGRAQQQPREEY